MADPQIITALDQTGIAYELYQHPAFTSCDISGPWHKASGRPGVRVKNLFLRNKNGKQHFLLLLPHEIEYDKARFKALSGEKCGFASDDRLTQYLNIKPGAVSPLSLVHDADNHVQAFIEATLLEAEALHLHPGHPEFSVQLKPHDLLAWLKAQGYEVQVIEWVSVETNETPSQT